MSDDRVLKIERLIKATPDRVFDAWVKPELLVKWWGPDGFETSDQALDVKPGGAWRTTMRSPEGNLYTCAGVYRAIEPPRRLEFTWSWEHADGSQGHETVVTVTFEPADGGTRMTLLQETFPDQETRDSHNEGWSSCLDCLERLFEQRAAA